jgi:hypothetical protein
MLLPVPSRADDTHRLFQPQPQPQPQPRLSTYSTPAIPLLVDAPFSMTLSFVPGSPCTGVCLKLAGSF